MKSRTSGRSIVLQAKRSTARAGAGAPAPRGAGLRPPRPTAPARPRARAADGTRVTLHSAQVPASALRGVVIRMFGRREGGQKLRESLPRLHAWAREGAPAR